MMPATIQTRATVDQRTMSPNALALLHDFANDASKAASYAEYKARFSGEDRQAYATAAQELRGLQRK